MGPGGLIQGFGPTDAVAMFVGEAGGQTEHHTGRPFSGKTGDVLTTYMRAADLSRSEVYITNLYPFWPGPGNPDPTPAQIKGEEWRLQADLERIKPRIIGTVGRIATAWFIGDVTMDATHGVPHSSPRAPGAVILPIVHPAAGFYDPDLAAYSQDDIQRFAYYLHNPVPKIKLPKARYVLWKTPPKVIRGAVDTEGLEDRPWGISWCEDGRTTNVWIYDPDAEPPRLEGFIWFQNALHDLKILRAMGISTRGLKYGDTMVGLFNLQLEPQGLKAAAYRHLGLRMGEFDETVRPHFNRVAIDYLQRAAALHYPKPKPVPVADYQKKQHRLYKPQGVGRRIKNALKAHEKDQALLDQGLIPPKPVRLEKRWGEIGKSQWVDQTEQYQGQVERGMGGETFPDFSIFCVPVKEATAYSGMDAFATNHLAPKVMTLVKSRGLTDVYEMDRRALPFVDRMQEVGMRVDVPKLTEFESELEELQTKARRKVQKVVGDRWFNPGSGDQVAAWLYEYRGLPILNYTDSDRGSTADASLKMLRGYHKDDQEVVDFLTGVMDYREANKYLGTFVRPVFSYLKRDRYGNWRLHANFRVTRVVSGRLCLAPDTLIDVVRDVSKYPKGIPIKDVKVGDLVYTFDDRRRLQLRRVKWSGQTGRSKLVRVHWLGSGRHTTGHVDCTPDHKFRLSSGEYRAAKDLVGGDSILALSRSQTNGYSRLHATGHRELRDHQFIYRKVHGVKPQMVHHRNENKLDNRLENLEGMTQRHHWQHHRSKFTPEQRKSQGVHAKAAWQRDREGMIARLKLRGPSNPGWLGLTKTWMISVLKESGGKPTVFRDKYGIDYATARAYMKRHGIDWRDYCTNDAIKNRRPRKPAGNHTITWVETLYGESDVYDIEVEETHNFIANELCVHNSSHDPNVLALPARTALGRKIRLCFVAGEGYVLVDADLSQLELRLGAHFSMDRTMRDAFEEGKDLHSITASIIFRIPLDRVGKDSPQRFIAKTINFAVFYGISARALLEQLYKADIFDFTLEQCQKFIDEWFKLFGSVRVYQKRVWAQAAKDGFVRDLFGRICYVPNLRLSDTKLREAAERLAINMPIQSTGSGITKRAEIRVHEYIESEEIREKIRPWLQMHDELLLEVKEGWEEEAKNLLETSMVADQRLVRVPLKAEASMGDSWGTAK